MQRIAERTSALAQFKKKGNLEKEFIFCVALAKDHEVAALHCKPVPFPSRSNSSSNNNNNDRIAHLQLALQFYRSALEISADLPTQQRQNCHHTELKLAVCRVLLEGGAVDDFSDYVQKAIPEGGKLRGEALLLAGQRYARLAGYQIPAILALEETKRLLTECPEADRPECLLLCAQASAELAALLRKPESHSQRDSAIGLLETVKSIDTDERVKIRADAQLAKVFLDAVGDVNGSFSFCLEAVDASRRLRQSSSSSHAKPTRPDQLIYCELLLLAGRLYRLQGDFRSAQTNLLLAKDEAINVVAPWDLIRQIEGEILLATERSTISSLAAAAAAKAASNDPELDPLTGQFLQTRDDRLAEEVLSRLAIRRLQAKQPLHYDPDFSYFADRKPTAVANRLFAAGMNIKPKSNKKHTLDLKRKRGRKPAGMGLTVHSQQRTTRTRVSRSAHSDGSDEDGYEEEEEDFIDDGAVDELSDSSPEKPPPPPPLLKLTKKQTIDPVPLIIVSSESEDEDEDEDEDAARLLTPPPMAANLQQLSLATATTDEKASPLPFHSKGSPVAEFPLMMFDSPVFEREKENRLGSQLKESFTLFNDDDDDNGRNDGAKQTLGGTQQATQASLKRITVKFQDECQSEPILLPLGGLSTISELIRRLQGRLDVLRSGQEAARLTVEGVAKLPGRARIFPEDLIEDVLVEGDELLALCCRSSSSSEASAQDAGSKPAAATFAGGSCSVFSEIAEKHRLLGLRRAPVHECLLLQVFESRLRKAIGSDLLDLSGLSIDSNGWRELSPLLRRFLEQNQSINRLSLRMNMLTEADVQPLLQGPRLGRVSSLDVAVNLICECDCQEAKWLTSLDLSYNPLRRLHLLSSTAVLLEVSLVECGLHLSGADAGMFVGGCEVLRVGGSTTFDSEFLAELCKSTSLRAISLFACSLPPGTLGTLALLPSLRMADFEHCEGLRVAALCSFVRRCSALEELRVDGGLSAEEAAEVKRVAFRDSATLRRFDWVGATDEAVEE